MIRIVLLALMLCPFFGSGQMAAAQGQKEKRRNVPPYDTIWVPMTPREVKIIANKGVDATNEATIGSKEFGSKIQGAIIILKAANREAKPASLFILHGDEIYNGVIAFDSMLTKADESIDWRTTKKETVQAADPVVQEDLTPKVDIKVIGNIGIISGKEKEPVQYKPIAILGEKIMLKLADIMQDDKYLYVKLGLANSSKEPYEIELVDFLYKNTQDARDYKQIQPEEKISNNVTSVPPKEYAKVVYAFPKFALTSKWVLEVTVKQKGGSKNVTITIPYKHINEALTF